MAIRKVRGAPTGQEIKFDKRVVSADQWGNTTLVIDWAAGEQQAEAKQGGKPEKPSWSGAGKVLKGAIERALIEHGTMMQPFGSEGGSFKSVPADRARAEFNRSYMAESQDAKRKAFKRQAEAAVSKSLVATREIMGVDWIWFCHEDPTPTPDT